VGQGDWHENKGHDYVISIHWDGMLYPEIEYLARLDKTHVHRRCPPTSGREYVLMRARVISNQDGFKVIETYAFSQTWNFHPYRMAFADGAANLDAVWKKIRENIEACEAGGTKLEDTLAGKCTSILNSGLSMENLPPYLMQADMGKITVVVEKCVREPYGQRSITLCDAPPVARFNFLYRSREALEELGVIDKATTPKAEGPIRKRKTTPKKPAEDGVISVAAAIQNFLEGRVL
jgi:hypothetical protein